MPNVLNYFWTACIKYLCTRSNTAIIASNKLKTGQTRLQRDRRMVINFDWCTVKYDVDCVLADCPTPFATICAAFLKIATLFLMYYYYKENILASNGTGATYNFHL